MKAGSSQRMGLDDALDELQSRVAALTRHQAAGFYSACAYGLFPLYENFHDNHKWGNPNLLRRAIDLGSGWATGVELPDALRLLQSLESVIPDGEKFDAPESTFAQDVVICADAALRASLPREQLNPAWVEHVLEPSSITACIVDTGYMDLGSSEESKAWRAQALGNSDLRGAVVACSRMLDFVGSRPQLHREDIVELRAMSPMLLPKKQM